MLTSLTRLWAWDGQTQRSGPGHSQGRSPGAVPQGLSASQGQSPGDPRALGETSEAREGNGQNTEPAPRSRVASPGTGNRGSWRPFPTRFWRGFLFLLFFTAGFLLTFFYTLGWGRETWGWTVRVWRVNGTGGGPAKEYLGGPAMPKEYPRPVKTDGGLWTIKPQGRLGNQMGEYATLFALAQANGRPAAILPAMKDSLAPLFNITLPVLSEDEARAIPWEDYWIHDWMSEEYRHIPGRHVKLTGYPCSWTFYHHLRAEIRREFTLHEPLVRKAQASLRQLREEWRRARCQSPEGCPPGDPTFIGVHVRRGDYVEFMPQHWRGVVADRGYLQQALDHFRRRYEHPLFVVTSNGMQWCRDNINVSLGDVVFAGDGIEGHPASDFALLVQCNHTVMTIGTFGIWAAYLTGGETVYLANYTLPDSPFLKIFKPEAAFLPEWIGIAADLSPLHSR
ncbi:galactoside alpha-(1,2)-fucosyltransferase 2-like [Ornithorhynchus anatinus]|uniref:L-Fucosyltransferase n=1 Tax=Ornithorhynchus anatinus TaxID=9258 RepID=K7EHC9_ORNAN|nr:galactoside alpha-(1,2)-fucosyltransferase 2-like [Ornithorhynchus anatinus]